MGTGKQKWRISFKKSPLKQQHQQQQEPLVFPEEFICQISGSLMADPIIVTSGHTFENHCVLACISLSFTPILPDGSVPNFCTTIPNKALKSTIFNWCSSSHVDPPKPLDFFSAEKLVRTLMAAQMNRVRSVLLTRPVCYSSPSSSEMDAQNPDIPENSKNFDAMNRVGTGLLTRPVCYSSPSSSEMDTVNASSCEEDEMIIKLKSTHVFEQEEAVISLRKLTRTREETRFQLCTPRLLSALRVVIASRYASVQVNSVAALVNLSLENRNKVKIVRSGIVPALIDVLKGGFFESQEHAAGALFSLALDDQNKTAVGVLGALPPLLHSLRSESERTRHDSALALYHLSLVQSNRAKLVKLGAVQSLLGMVRTGHMTGRILLILCNMAASSEGRGAMLDGGAVECFVGMLRKGEFDAESIRESCVTALYGLSHGGLRFKGLAKEAAAEEMLMKLEDFLGSEKAKDKVKRILEVLTEKDEEEEEIDLEELLNSDDEDDGIS